MKIILATYGSIGDLQPLLTLSLALKERGHEVLLCAQPEDADRVKNQQCPYYPLGSNLMEFGKQLNVDGPHQKSLIALNASILFLRQEIRNQFECLTTIVNQADIILWAPAAYALPSLAEYFHKPHRFLAICPQSIPSSHHPYFHISNQQMPRWMNIFTWWFGYQFENIACKRVINEERAKLGMPPIREIYDYKLGDEVLVASDPILGRIPSDYKHPCVQLGYFHASAKGELDRDLQNYIAAGPKPVYIGFGSMITEKYAKKFTVFVRQVAQATQHRLVIAGVADTHGEIAKGCYAVGHVPHSLLFPQMSAIVHHGGAGTTATAARAGVPQIIIPHFFDQFYWGRQIFLLGLGPLPIKRWVLTVPRLKNAIQECLANPSFQRRATDIAYRLREQDPLGNAVAYIESIGRDTRFSHSKRPYLHYGDTNHRQTRWFVKTLNRSKQNGKPPATQRG